MNLNRCAGSGSFIRWHSDNEPLFGPQNSPKLIVSLSLGNSVEFMVVRETYDALRRLMAPLLGKRPGVPPEPEAQGAAVAGGYVAAGAPLLAVPTLHGEYSVDGTTVSFLLAENLELTKKEEEEEKERRRMSKEVAKHVTRMRELDRRKKAGERLSAPDDDAWREWKSVSLGLPSREERMSKRKRKKRRRKKLPKSSLAPAPHTWKPGHLSTSPCLPVLLR